MLSCSGISRICKRGLFRASQNYVLAHNVGGRGPTHVNQSHAESTTCAVRVASARACARVSSVCN